LRLRENFFILLRLNLNLNLSFPYNQISKVQL
jgi:hypothetical protein